MVTCDDSLHGVVEVREVDACLHVARREQRSLVTDVMNVSSCATQQRTMQYSAINYINTHGDIKNGNAKRKLP